MGRYLVVDEATKTILGGPYLWDGETEWTPAEPGTVMRESEAFEAGYAWPEIV